MDWRRKYYGQPTHDADFAEAQVLPIVLSGDSHTFWVNNLKGATGQKRAVEFGTTAVSSPSIADVLGGFPLGKALMQVNKEVVFCDQYSKRFVHLRLTETHAEARLMKVSTIYSKALETTFLATYCIQPDGGLEAV